MPKRCIEIIDKQVDAIEVVGDNILVNPSNLDEYLTDVNYCLKVFKIYNDANYHFDKKATR